MMAEAIAKFGTQRSALVTGSFRAGTSYICQLLAANGMPGLRNERFADFWEFSRGGSDEKFCERIEAVFSSSKGGIFFSKIMWPHRNNLSLSLGCGREDSAAFSKMFPDAKWLNIVRRDKVGQAISFWKAKTTNQWQQTGSSVAHEPEYDYAAVRKCYNEILAHDMLWEDFHKNAGTDVCHVFYEDFVGREEENLRLLLDYFSEHRLEKGEVKVHTVLKKQRNCHSAMIREKFMDDLYRSGN